MGGAARQSLQATKGRFALYRDPNGQALSREERNYLEADAVPAAGPPPKLTFTEWRAEYCGP
ncbi:hypothetical protein LJR267_009927 [Paraburkholderia hospita]|jgi:hypothetical protein|uniref:hypothetical protein n=1 Tax=Paraburkholderia hospita TaxID=169430 RepID=UPI003ED01BF4